MGTTIIGGLGVGLGQSVNPFLASTVLAATIAQDTAEANLDNAHAKALYLQDAQSWLTNAIHQRDLNQPLPTLRPPPLVIHIDQTTGAETIGPDVVATPPLLPAAITPTSTNTSSGEMKSTKTAPDQLDQVMAGLGQMWDMLVQMQAELAAIKTKLAA